MWGSYYKEYVTQREPMNALLFLQHLKVAHHVTKAARFAEAYERFVFEEGYGALAVQARRVGGRSINYSDDVLNWLAWYTLLRMEKDLRIREFYVRGLRRAWEDVGDSPGDPAAWRSVVCVCGGGLSE